MATVQRCFDMIATTDNLIDNWAAPEGFLKEYQARRDSILKKICADFGKTDTWDLNKFHLGCTLNGEIAELYLALKRWIAENYKFPAK